MQTGIIRRMHDSAVLGRWRADVASIVVETSDPVLRSTSDEILRTAQSIPIHAAERREFATHSDTLNEAPSTIKYLALFALELEQRGYMLEPDEA